MELSRDAAGVRRSISPGDLVRHPETGEEVRVGFVDRHFLRVAQLVSERGKISFVALWKIEGRR